MRWNFQRLFLLSTMSFLLLLSIALMSYRHACCYDRSNKEAKQDDLVEQNELDGIQSCIPFYSLLEKHLLLKTGKRSQAIPTTFSLISAFEYENYSVITTEADGYYGKVVFCRYLDGQQKEIKPVTMSVIFPEFTVYCCKRKGAYYMSFTQSAYDDILDIVPVTSRLQNELRYNLSMCVKPMYGLFTKFLLFAEFVEHYKLQGVQYFYIYTKELDPYTSKYKNLEGEICMINSNQSIDPTAGIVQILKHYVKRGDAELISFREEQDRPSIEWHLVGTQDCIHRSKYHSRYVIFADLDERILPLRSPTLRNLIMDEMGSHPSYGMMRFVTQWVLQTRPHPTSYEGYTTLNKHLPTLVFRNTSSPAPIGHTAKCVVDPKKVFLMWVHHVEVYFPTYEGYEVPASDAIIRHYRDVESDDWAALYLPEVEKFGPFNLTTYPVHLLPKLYHNVKNVLDRVYLLPGLAGK